MVTRKREIGDIGEKSAKKFLGKHGFTILGQNYLKKWGEIDIIAQKDSVLYFIEVKTVSRKYCSDDEWRPEDNVHEWKKKRLARAIRTYIAEMHIPEETEWQIDVIVVYLDFTKRIAKIRVVEDIIL